MTRSCINVCLLAVISLLFGVIWQGSANAAAPIITPLGQVSGTFRSAAALDVDSVGNLYVSDTKNFAIFKYDKFGTRIATFPVAGIKAAGLVVAADGRIFVPVASDPASAFADKVVILDASGTPIGALGQGAGEFGAAGSLDIDLNGNIYVVDQLALNIEVFAPGASAGAVFGGLSFAGGISLAISPDNEIYVSNYTMDTATGAVPELYIYDAAGVLKEEILVGTGFGADPLNRIGAVTFDGSGRFYVSDSSLNSIRVMERAVGLPAIQLAKYTAGIDQAPAMAFDALTNRLYVNHASASVDILGIDGGTTPIKSNTAPSVPVPVTVGVVSSLTPNLVFNNSTDPENDVLTYNVQIQNATGTVVDVLSVAEGSGTSVVSVVNSLVENSSYSWQVQADDGLLTSAWSSPQPIYINALEEAPSAPSVTSFMNSEIAGSDALLSWTASVDADPSSTISYRVEIFEAGTLFKSAVVSSLSVSVSAVSDVLVPGTVYGWKVVAVDNTNLEAVSLNVGSFEFQTSVLSVVSNAPAAQVYLSGHHGYAGRLIGTAPVEIRGLVAGDYSVVVEAPGFIPYVSAVSIIKNTRVEAVTQLEGAMLATSYATHNLNLNGLPAAGVGSSPSVVDLDYDGILDLLLVDNGFLKFFKGSLAVDPLAANTLEDLSTGVLKGLPAPERVVFAATPVVLGVPQISGAAPCLVDWNNDDQLDLLIGDDSGSISLYLGLGSLAFSSNATVLVGVNGSAVPAVADVDGDGAKDLVVATGNTLLFFRNAGTDSSPVLDAEHLMLTAAAPVSPVFSDWNADGARQLLLFSQGELYAAQMLGNDVTAMSPLGLPVADATGVFAVNLAGSHYADLVFSTSAGSLVVANGQAGQFAPAYVAALQARLAEVERLVLLQAPELIGHVANISSRLGRGKYDSALKKAQQLSAMLGSTTPAGIAVEEFISIL